MNTHRDTTGQAARTTIEQNKQIVRRLVADVMNTGKLDLIDQLYHPRLAPAARRWIEPFRASFSDLHMRVNQLIAEDDTVAARFSCSGTHTGPWLGHPPTGRRFTNVSEVYVFRIEGGRITQVWGIEDNHTRLRQLGLQGN